MHIHNSRMRTTLPASQDTIVVFLIGMRVNRWWKIHKWLPAARAMPRMLKELRAHPELGFLGAEEGFGRTTLMVQYWRSKDDLYRYARDRNSAHLPAWRDFNRKIGTSGDVGVWHESYEVQRSSIHSLYLNMPAFGLGRVTDLLDAKPHPARRPEELVAPPAPRPSH